MGDLCVKGEKQPNDNNEKEKSDCIFSCKNKNKNEDTNDECLNLIINYSSIYDIIFSELEEKYNLFKYLKLNDFLNLFNGVEQDEKLILDTNLTLHTNRKYL